MECRICTANYSKELLKKRQGLAAGNMEAWRDSAPRYADWSSYQLNLKLEIGRAPRYADWSAK